jgi:hypothetical protein
MTPVGYRLVERFSPRSGEGWRRYLEWSGLSHLTEVVGLDASLCPGLVQEYADEDWEHLVFAEHLFACFDGVAYALRRVGDAFDKGRHQVLALAREPALEDAPQELPGFRFMGFDLVDESTSISALTNCSGFEGALAPADLSACGLVVDPRRAHAIREALATLFPEEHHADCAVWAIWRQEGTG